MASVSLGQEVHRANVCSVCLREKTDARLLPCLHSFCRKCIDQEAVAADLAHRLRCSVCRAECSLPKSGASGLLRDVTICGAEKMRDCRVCREHGRDGRPDVWCANCQTALCKEHVLSHVGSSPGPHAVQALGQSVGGKTSVTRQGAALCADHSQPLIFFCVQCDVAICGHCGLIGKHKTHQPSFLLVEEAIARKKEAVTSKACKLQRDFLPRLQNSTKVVNTVKAQLGSQTDRVRDQIETARRQAVDTIEAYAKQLLQDVDDIEMQRTKLLDSQLSGLKRLTGGVTTAVRFSQEIEKSDTTFEETAALLAALDSRLSALVSSEQSFSGKPSAHPHVTFGIGSTDVFINHGPDIMGRVKACNVSAAHSCVEGGFTQRSSPNRPFTFIIIAKDKYGGPLTFGGHCLTTKFLKRPGAHTADAPNVEVTDKNNGRYRLSFVTPHLGQYSVEVYINGIKMAQALTALCRPSVKCRRFDPTECQPYIILSEDRRTATYTVPGYTSNRKAVLGEQGARHGEMSWKLCMRCDDEQQHFIGVAAKAGLTAGDRRYDRAYSWNGLRGEVCFQGKVRVTELGRLWSKGDVVELKLDCDDHTLRLTNFRTGRTGLIENLPDEELFPYCSSCYGGDFMGFVD